MIQPAAARACDRNCTRAGCRSLANSDFLPFDVLACSGRSFVSRCIRSVTAPVDHWRRPWLDVSHVMLCFQFGEGSGGGSSRTAEIEATTECDERPIYRHQAIEGVQVHWPERRVPLYAGWVWRLRLAAPHKQSIDSRRLLTRFLLSFEDEPYDRLGALLAGLKAPHADDLSRLFCSELVAAALEQFQLLEPGAANRWTPSALVEQLVERGVYETPERIR